MATAPGKPQQLHNFPLPLKWGQPPLCATHSNHRSDNSACDSPSSSSRVHEHLESASDPHRDRRIGSNHPRVGSRSARLHRISFNSSSTFLRKSSKLPIEKSSVAQSETGGKSNDKSGVLEAEEEVKVEEKPKKAKEDGNLKPWKLRVRKGGTSSNNIEEFGDTVIELNEQRDKENLQNLHAKSMRLRTMVESGGGCNGVLERKEKKKFWIALSREEIEEDVFIITGSRPSRRPKKRPKNLQKLLDNFFPGLWLAGTTVDSYKAADL